MIGDGVIYHQSTDIKDKIAFLKSSEEPYPLSDKNAKALVNISDSDYKRLQGETKIKVDIQGKVTERTSYNVVGKILCSKSDAKDIIISAHMDSIIGMGADELGMLGSRAYIANHAEKLPNCAFVFNIDEIGGNQDIYIEASGKGQKEYSDLHMPNKNLCSVTDYELQWASPGIFNSNFMIPDWLSKDIKDSCAELNYSFQNGNGMGSDHQMFAMYGIPATSIAIIGDSKTHSTEDTPDKVNSVSMLKAARIVASVVNKTLNSATQ
jgi:hypothetical protein